MLVRIYKFITTLSITSLNHLIFGKESQWESMLQLYLLI